ncbi:hypothetical protein AVEN_184042-1, partial [Araneus ventricosus]
MSAEARTSKEASQRTESSIQFLRTVADSMGRGNGAPGRIPT